MSRGRKKNQDSKSISPQDGFEKKRVVTMWGDLARDPMLIPFWYAFGGATRLTNQMRKDAMAQIFAATEEAYLRLDAAYFERMARIVSAVSGRRTNHGIKDSADPNLRALIESYNLCTFETSELPTRAEVFDCALALYADFTQEPANRSRYCKQLGLKFSESKKRRGKSRNA